MIIAGGKPKLCCRRHAKQEGGVYGHPYALRVCKSRMQCTRAYVGKCEKGLCEKTQGFMATPTSGSMKRFAGLSF